MSWEVWGRLLGLVSAVTMVNGMVVTPVSASESRATPAAGMASRVQMYLIAIGDNGKSGKKVGCGDSLLGITRKIPPTMTPLTAVIRMEIRNHRQFYGRSGLYNALYQSRLDLQRATVVNGTATIHLTGKLRLGGACDAPRIRAQLRHTALQFPTVQRVFVYVNGTSLSKALSTR